MIITTGLDCSSNDFKKLILSPWHLLLHHKVSITIIEEINTVFNHLVYSLASKISIIKSYRILNKEKINVGKLYFFFAIASVMFNSLQPCELYIACQAPLFMGFSRQEYRSGLTCSLPGVSSQPRDGTHISYVSPTSAGKFFTTSTIWEAPQFFFSQVYVIFRKCTFK